MQKNARRWCSLWSRYEAISRFGNTLFCVVVRRKCCVSRESRTASCRALVNDIALPAYTNWQHTNQAFHTTSEQFCAGKAELATVRAQWLAAQHAWLALQPVLVPPSPADHLGLQIQFWPDKRNLAAKQTEELLQKIRRLRSRV
ncbi:MAG: hypothetical protein IPN27_07505 [Cellvibrionales bacterium]|nr:hypothetical protein [Cellvibrionales bacterium]